ncbi:MAG: NAD(P)-dependent oxidoreductase [Planctomycetota bacterium]
MQHCLITGGSGFVGIELARQLVAAGSRVTIYDLHPPAAPDIEAQLTYVQGDVRDRQKLTDASAGVEVFFHLAAAVPLTRAGKAFDEINVGGVENAVAACRAHGVGQLVHLSSSAIYGVPTGCPVREDTPPQPFGLYGPAKLRGERVAIAARSPDLAVAVIRPRTVIGPGRLGIFDLLFDWIRKDAPIYLLGACDQPFQLVSNRDMAAAMAATAAARASGEYNVGADEYTSLRTDLEALADSVGSRSRVVGVPAWLARPTLRALDALRLSPLVDWHYRTIDKEFWFDNQRPKAELDWRPQDSNLTMLRDAYEWHVAHHATLARSGRSAHRSPLTRGLLGVLSALPIIGRSGKRRPS